MASIHPRKLASGGVSWRVMFRVNGAQAQETFRHEKGAIGFASLVDRIGGDAARRILEARRTHVDVPTLREWTLTYLDPETGMLTGIEPSTRDEYGRIAERSFLQILGEMPLNAIEKQDVGRWVEWQERQKPTRGEGTLSAKTIRNYHGLLSSILQAAVPKHIEANPAHRTRLSAGQKQEAQFLTRSEFAALLEHLPERWHPLALFLVGTGMRWGEATALTWGDLSLESSPATARVNKAWKKSGMLKHPKTSRSNRTISLWPELVAAMGEPGTSTDLIFTATRGGRLWTGQFHERVWQPALNRANAAGMPKRPRIHDLRHTHASWLIASGAPLPYIQARLGHESIQTTVNVYGSLLPDAHAQMSAMMSEAMADVLPPLELSR